MKWILIGIAMTASLFSHPTHLIFDLGQVMLEWNPTKMVNIIFDGEERIPHELVEVFKTPLWLDYDAGLYSRKGLIEALPLGYDKKQFAKLESQISNIIQPLPEMIEIVEEVKQQGYKVYILSNMPKEIFEEIDEKYHLSDLFDGRVVVSSYTGSIKPHPPIYRFLLSSFSLHADECLFIDDRAENIEGGKQCGIDGIVFQSPHQLRKEFQQRGILPP